MLTPDLRGRPGHAVLSLSFAGASRPLGLALRTLAVLGPDATLLHGGLDRIRGHAQGRLLVSVPAGGLHIDSARTALAADHIEVLGYVPAND
jgi:D-methionine transport system ATP-binding protein